MVTKILDFIHKHPKYQLVKSFFYYLDRFSTFTLLLTGTIQDKIKVKISQNFVAFADYMNFTFMFHGQQTLEISRTFLSAMLGINYYKGILKPRSFVFLSFHHRAIVQWKFAIG